MPLVHVAAFVMTVVIFVRAEIFGPWGYPGMRHASVSPNVGIALLVGAPMALHLARGRQSVLRHQVVSRPSRLALKRSYREAVGRSRKPQASLMGARRRWLGDLDSNQG